MLTQEAAVRGQQNPSNRPFLTTIGSTAKQSKTRPRKTPPFKSQLAKHDEADEDANLGKHPQRSRRTAVPITAPKPNSPGFVPETTSDPVVERASGGANRYPPPSPPNPPPTPSAGGTGYNGGHSMTQGDEHEIIIRRAQIF